MFVIAKLDYVIKEIDIGVNPNFILNESMSNSTKTYFAEFLSTYIPDCNIVFYRNEIRSMWSI